MTEKKESRDEKLIEELYEKLWWYTHEATDEEFDEKEVDAITRLLDILEPVHDDQAYASGADAALQRFWERYGEEEEAAGTDVDAEEDFSFAETAGTVRAATDVREHGNVDSEKLSRKSFGKSSVHQRSGRWRRVIVRIGIGLAACVVLLVTVNMGCYAIKKKSFFEIVRDGVGRTEIIVTGNVEAIEDGEDNVVECSSWEKAEELVGEDLLEPTYIPEGYELRALTVQNAELRKYVKGWYDDGNEKYLRIYVNIYQDEFKKDMAQYEDWKLIEEDDEKKYQIYFREGVYEAFLFRGKCVYYILNNESKEILNKVVNGILDE